MASPPHKLGHPCAAETDLWAFRDGRKPISGKKLIRELSVALDSALECVQRTSANQCSANQGLLLDALIRAGELESALADTGVAAESVLASLTDALAEMLLGQVSGNLFLANRVVAYRRQLENINLPETLLVSPPEGFSYYALHPSDFAVTAIKAVSGLEPVAVVGIRSIGTTLGAVAGAALRMAGHVVNRITVRPTGHPYNRSTEFSADQITWIRKQQNKSAKFVVVDEGPGRSGSTFLSVGEALEDAGVERERIAFLGSREPETALLCAHDGARRWQRFRFIHCSNNTYSRFRDYTYIGGGEWRNLFFPDESLWPACWPQMERLKFLSPDHNRVLKFEGMGRIGAAVRERAQHLATSGFGCEVEDCGDGFLSYAVAKHPPLSASDLDSNMIELLAKYCAFRCREFRVEDSPEELSPMLRFNLKHEFGVELHSDIDLLESGPAVLVDARMQPHEWVAASNGRILKTDAASHGDDHFFPGPTDIAWDLAGAAIEWNLNQDALQFLLSQFQKLAGDDVRARLPVFMLAYCVVRLATCKLAITTVPGSADESRLLAEYRFYRHHAERLIQQATGKEHSFKVTESNLQVV